MKSRLWTWIATACAGKALMLAGASPALAQRMSQPGGTCAGIANLQCPGGQVCVFSGPNHPDRAGVCRPANGGGGGGGGQVCPQIFQPVCGVNGVTYANRCIAGSRGVAVAHDGQCGVVPPRPVPPRPRPYPRPPQVCTDIYQPVCGRDGRTYPNACVAHANGARVRHAGECRPPVGYGPPPEYGPPPAYGPPQSYAAPPSYGLPPAPVPYGSYPTRPTYARPYGERG
ncbi:hypothetical protein BH09PSE2_BH09PSE2_11430 [soil metagenome]